MFVRLKPTTHPNHIFAIFDEILLTHSRQVFWHRGDRFTGTMAQGVRKTVFGASDNFTLKQTYSATEIS